MRVRNLGAAASVPVRADGALAFQRIWRTTDTELKVVVDAAGAATDLHGHAHRHDVLVLDGSGHVSNPSGERSIGRDDVVAIAPWERHAFGAAPDEALRFVCVDSPGNRTVAGSVIKPGTPRQVKHGDDAGTSATDRDRP
jgi:mannose-6-phosphate isomerase-like protein (cupin superfamily)